MNSKSSSLSHQMQLCKALGSEGLNKVISQLNNVREIYLSGCNLKHAPQIGSLPELRILDLSYNEISEVDNSFYHEKLTTLNIEANPIPNISMDRFPEVTVLKCGSKHTKSISDSTLLRVKDGTLSISVATSFKGYLQLPEYSVIEGGPDDIQIYLNKEEIFIRTLEDIQLYSQSLKSSEKQYKVLRLSKTSCTPEFIQNVEFQNLLGQLQNIERLILPASDLQSFPAELCFSKLTKVDFSNSDLQPKALSGLPETVSTLVARKCNLKELPCCPHVSTLDVRDNKITTMNTSVTFAKLNHLMLENNRLRVIDFDRMYIPELKRLDCGSNECHFISFPVVDEIIADRLCLEVSPKTNLWLPSRSCLNSETLQSYVKSPERHLSHLSEMDAVDSLMWLLDESQREFSSFDLSGQAQLVEALGSERLQTVLEKRSLQGITFLSLSNNNLYVIPSVACLENLQTLDISSNNLAKIDCTFSHGSLTDLYLQENPIPSLEFSVQLFPKLKNLRVGDEETHTIDKTILLKVLEGSLFLVIDGRYKNSFKFPTYDTISDRELLKRYLNTEELNLSVSEVGDRLRFRHIEEQIKKSGNEMTVLNLNGQTSVSEHGEIGTWRNELLGHQNLRNIKSLSLNGCNITSFPMLKDMNCLESLDLGGNRLEHQQPGNTMAHLKELYLKDCGLTRMFSLRYVPTLRELDIRENNIDSMRQFYDVDKAHPLEKLSIIGNPIEEINIKVNCFERLKELQVGSKVTKYINFNVLKRVAAGFLSIDVPKVCQKYLLLCPFNILESGKFAIEKFLTDTEVNLSYISRTMDRYNALLWLFDQKDKIETLNFSGYKEFCNDANVHLPELFDHHRLRDVKTVFLDHCELKEIPILSKSLQNLKVLYLNNNQLTGIQSQIDVTLFQSNPNLEKLYVDSNPIEKIHISSPSDNFPKLEVLQVGSEKTHYLSSSILEAAIRERNPLIVKVVEAYGKFLTTPPFEIIQEGPEGLRTYMQMKLEKSSSSSYDMHENTTQNVLMFLGKPFAGKTSLLRTLRENEPTTTLMEERTIILERGKLELGNRVIISTYDFGAQDIYEIEYPVFLRGQNIIALIVIPLDEYNEKTHDKLVTRWLQNCVLCADCKVIFVTSKCEEYSAELIEVKRKEIKERILEYIGEEIQFLKNERDAIRKVSAVKGKFDLDRIEHSLKFFEALKGNVKVIATSIYNSDSLEELREAVRSKIKSDRLESDRELFPKVINYIRKEGAKRRFHMTLDEVVKHFKTEYKQQKNLPSQLFSKVKQKIGIEDPTDLREQIKLCLAYYHRKGWILWYESYEKCIYVNVGRILQLHKKLYRETKDLEDLLTYDSQKLHQLEEFLEEVEFREQRNTFLQSGVVSNNILAYLWAEFNLTPEEMDGMIKLLLANGHCFAAHGIECVPNDSQVLVFPWFVNKKSIDSNFWVKEWPADIPYDHIEFHVNYGFSRLPSGVYERISVHLQHVLRPNCKRKDWADGIYVQNGAMKLLIQRHTDIDIPEVSIKFRAPSKDIVLMWDWCLNVYKKVLNMVIEQTKIVPYRRKAFVCPHCILSGLPSDKCDSYRLGVVMEAECDHQTETMCGTTVIPAAFVNPLLKGMYNKTYFPIEFLGDSVLVA